MKHTEIAVMEHFLKQAHIKPDRVEKRGRSWVIVGRHDGINQPVFKNISDISLYVLRRNADIENGETRYINGKITYEK